MSHQTTVKVRFHELDPYDHVNHTNYLNYFETGRIEALEEMAFGLDRLKQEGIQIVVVGLTARFHVPATLHEVLTITTEVAELRRASCRWHQEARIHDRLVATLEIEAAFTNREGRPRRPPEGFAEAVAAL